MDEYEKRAKFCAGGPEKKRGGDKRPIKCLALFRRLGAVAHLPTTNITQLRLGNCNNCKYVLRMSKLDFLTRKVQQC